MSFLGESGLIGTIGIFNIRKEHYRAEFGYMLHPDYHRQNLMQEAFQPVLEYAFTTMGLHSLEANVDPMNKASIGILEKNGFVREAYFREDFYWQGKFLDSAVYSLLAPKQQTT
jgi:ribosomal-protein-alanine N-acetyltransferase